MLSGLSRITPKREYSVNSGFQGVVPAPKASELPGSSLEMKFLVCFVDIMDQKLWGWSPGICVPVALQVIWISFMFEIAGVIRADGTRLPDSITALPRY